ncbi:hypothetical protein [Aestuariimicrobium kwangyangense]|uniref:hypothetical protein n=1 Tax=Aestuariimicrobium kwangyangense TaxID=396389 RepID=UPI0003B67EEF|nr:hypothetical protein [Aestuariimicrobium kwangyangense]
MLTVAFVVGLTSLLGGCNVRSVGLAGIGVDAHGSPVGYLQVCENHVDGATLYVSDVDQTGSWQASSPVTDFVRWSLSAPGPGWTIDRALGGLKPGVDYTFYGWTTDNTSSASGVTFTTADLARLKPGQVMYEGGTNASTTEDLTTISGEDEFRAIACA